MSVTECATLVKPLYVSTSPFFFRSILQGRKGVVVRLELLPSIRSVIMVLLVAILAQLLP